MAAIWKDYCGSLVGQLAVIAVEPAGKTSFVYSCMQARLLGQHNGKWHISDISLVFVSQPLTAVITVMDTFISSMASHHTELNELKKAAV